MLWSILKGTIEREPLKIELSGLLAQDKTFPAKPRSLSSPSTVTSALSYMQSFYPCMPISPINLEKEYKREFKDGKTDPCHSQTLPLTSHVFKKVAMLLRLKFEVTSSL